eukprot:gene2032-1222_t
MEAAVSRGVPQASRNERLLRGYHLARQVRLLHHYDAAVRRNALINPLFHSCLTEEARAAAEAHMEVLEEALAARPPPSAPHPHASNEGEVGVAAEQRRFENAALARRVMSFMEYPDLRGAIDEPAAAPHRFFYVAPLSGDAPHHTDKIFVRFAKEEMGEESLNTYFGRYGQVSCTRCRMVRLLDGGFTPVMVDFLSSAIDCHPSQILLQDFIIRLDSMNNAVQAVQRAYYKELLFIALSDEEHNMYGPADVDKLLQGFLPRRWPYFPLPLQLPEEPVATPGDLDAAAFRRHKRKRTHRFRRLLRHRESPAPPAADRLSTSSSSNSSSSSSSASSTSGSASLSSSSSDEDDEAGGAGDFVPDVVITGFPYWTTVDQIRVLLQAFGTVVSLRLSVDDRNGVFHGAVLVGMSAPLEALRLSEGMHGWDLQGYTLTSGIITPGLDVVSLLTGEVREKNEEPLSEHFSISVNERLWV